MAAILAAYRLINIFVIKIRSACRFNSGNKSGKEMIIAIEEMVPTSKVPARYSLNKTSNLEPNIMVPDTGRDIIK
jgi:hypothetical protein